MYYQDQKFQHISSSFNSGQQEWKIHRLRLKLKLRKYETCNEVNYKLISISCFSIYDKWSTCIQLICMYIYKYATYFRGFEIQNDPRILNYETLLILNYDNFFGFSCSLGKLRNAVAYWQHGQPKECIQEKHGNLISSFNIWRFLFKKQGQYLFHPMLATEIGFSSKRFKNKDKCFLA